MFLVLYKRARKAVMVFVVKLILENAYDSLRNSPCLRLNFSLLVSNITALNTHAI